MVLLLIIPPALFVILEFVASSKLIALELPALIVPELVTVKPDWFFPWIAFEESAPLEKIEDPDSTVTVPLFFVKIFTVYDESVDKVVDSEIVKDVPSALNFFWVVLLLLVLFTVLSPIIFSE